MKKNTSRGASLFLICAMSLSQGSDGKSGWRSLIRGKDLKGWKRMGGFAKFERHADGIVGTAVRGSPGSSLCTEEVFTDFELTFEVKLDPRLDCGVQIRCKSIPYSKGARVRGYEVEVAANGKAGYIYDEARRTWLSKSQSASPGPSPFKPNSWNHFRVHCVGDIIRTWVNGIPVGYVVDKMARSGFIGLQVHSFRGKEPAQVIWRNIKVRTLKDKISPVIDSVEKACIERTVYMVGRRKAERLGELVHQKAPRLVVECGTAIGYSGLWIARELQAQGFGHLITIEIDPERSKEAQEAFRKAGLSQYATFKVGDARQVVKEIEGPVDFLFLDCGFSNYFPCFKNIEAKLAQRSFVVADNVGIGQTAMEDYLNYVRKKYKSRTEWFETHLPWSKRDAMEITVIEK